jgi:hypothetical protein
MHPRVKDVIANDFKLVLTFEDGKKKIFDVKPYLNIGMFKELSDVNLFKTVRVSFGSVSWKNGQDLILILCILKAAMLLRIKQTIASLEGMLSFVS